ncbi:F-type H+-transporting ATPase subunit b [Rubricella aquisinus]|uniref:ATP synthase subunit b n=1 Tax=Rubricella aquisinus TaxID=2028108 RepID=A0A840WQL5_9RHOB|nr:ATP F0F1 synthase subunit B [Rubricella aquisinus]MBB5517011.1 F-type H+-transporting ATPase subunit b [Rubricella aquisinus]
MSYLYNTDIVVAIGFVIFIALLVYLKVPGMLAKMLDDRAAKIEADIAEARTLREEAQQVLASYERKQKEVEDLTASIVAKAREDAEANAVQAKADLEVAIERRIQAAKDQIASAESAAVKAVKDQAVAVAVAAASDVIRAKMDAGKSGALIDKSIETVSAKLH